MLRFKFRDIIKNRYKLEHSFSYGGTNCFRFRDCENNAPKLTSLFDSCDVILRMN